MLLSADGPAAPGDGPAVLVTGATGLVGSQAVAAVLTGGAACVVAPVRRHHPPGAVQAAVRAAVPPGELPDDWASRLCVTALPEGADDPSRPDPVPGMDEIVERCGVDEVVHCAGSLSYTDADQLEAVNVVMTERLVRAGERWGVRRFVHVSTAFTAGYPDPGVEIRESLHDEPGADPTPYTASKRRAEAIVATSDVPYLILRPSIVIGESATGHYAGPRYGLYQLWSGLERFLLDDRHAEIHFVAPDHPLPLLHQDAFRAGLTGARRHLPDGSICHLTSRRSPSVAEVAEMFFVEHLKPGRVHLHARLGDVPREELSRPNRMLLRLAAVNLDIAGHHWPFALGGIDVLTAAGAGVIDATLDTVRRCQDTFLARSSRYTRYVEHFGHMLPRRVEVVRATAPAAP